MTTAKRNTWQKDAVKHALGEAIGFVSAQQLHLVLRNHGSTIGLATVYRALADLAAAGEADSLQGASGELLYRACTTDHHHHLICTECGGVDDVPAAPAIEGALHHAVDEIERATGFRTAAHRIDLVGRCRACR